MLDIFKPSIPPSNEPIMPMFWGCCHHWTWHYCCLMWGVETRILAASNPGWGEKQQQQCSDISSQWILWWPGYSPAASMGRRGRVNENIQRKILSINVNNVTQKHGNKLLCKCLKWGGAISAGAGVCVADMSAMLDNVVQYSVMACLPLEIGNLVIAKIHKYFEYL